MSRIGEAWMGLTAIVALALGPGAVPLHAFVDESVVVNEICVVPSAGPRFIELWNRGPNPVNAGGTWWVCDQPSALYVRLLQTPSFGGPSASPPIVLGPGDFLVIWWTLPGGAYATQANTAGTTTHLVNIGVPASVGFSTTHGNFSIWDQPPPGDTGFFDLPNLLRDFVAWGPGGVYTGMKRGCVASDPLAALWPPPIAGDCMTPMPAPQFAAVDSSVLLTFSNLSVNYNGQSHNNPADYFVAPATPGQPNVMPGDLDGDLDMDNDDFAIFSGCLNQPAAGPCAGADFDQSGTVDCTDWPFFQADWLQYSVLPAPSLPPCEPPACTLRGDMNNDGMINADDMQGFLDTFTGSNTAAYSLCAADMNQDNVIDCRDCLDFELALIDNAPSCLPGDANNDGVVNGDDIQPYVDMVLAGPAVCQTPASRCVLDTQPDQTWNEDDIVAFVNILLAP